MGRKPYKHSNLPRGMRARPRGNLVHYYLDTGGKPRKEIPLGSDYATAVQKWAELTMYKQPDVVTFEYVVKQYWEKVIPTKAPRTQKDNESEREWLLRFFNNPPAPLDQIEPKHIRQYLDWRVQESKSLALIKGKPITKTTGQVRANREKSLFSHIWNFAREYGYTKLPNPCLGVHSFKEKGRKDILVSESAYHRVLEHADKQVSFTLRLAYLTGQRPSDVLKMSYTNISDNCLNITQGKTGGKLRIKIEGELKLLINEITIYKSSLNLSVHHMQLLINEKGNPLTYGMFRSRFDKARKKAGVNKSDFQLRDMRAKAATDTDEKSGIRNAQALLGHSTEQMTSHYVRERVGKKVNPVK